MKQFLKDSRHIRPCVLGYNLVKPNRIRYRIGDYKAYTRGGFVVEKAVQSLGLSEEVFRPTDDSVMAYCGLRTHNNLVFGVNPKSKFPESNLLHELAHAYYGDLEPMNCYNLYKAYYEVRADMFSFYMSRILGYRGLTLRKSLVLSWAKHTIANLDIEDQVKRDVDKFLEMGA